MAREPGLLVVTFDRDDGSDPVPWPVLEPWTRSRAVTVADVRADLSGGGLEVALCSDLVYLRVGAHLGLPPGPLVPGAGLVWALGRAGRAALDRGLLGDGRIGGAEAVELGLAQRVLAGHEGLPLPEPHSVVALTAARDLARAGAGGAGALQLELATFRLLFATGEPQEGARAFVEKRDPEFD